MMDIEIFHFLLTPEGQQLLNEAAQLLLDDSSELKALSTLRKHHAAPIAAAAVETVLLRCRAKTKFSRADKMYFTKEALEQASGETVSSYRARRYANFEHIADMACGIGGDLIHLASAIAVDSDSLRLEMAKANALAYGIVDKIEFRLADIEEMETPDVQAIWFDPSRRIAGRRKISLSDYSPSVTKMLNKWQPNIPAIGIKVAPALPYEEIPDDCEVEFISVDRELKEAVLWFGTLKTARRRATVLPSEDTLIDEPVDEIPIKEPGQVLYEPDPAVIRAHLVEQLAARLGAWKLGAKVAYLSSDQIFPTPFARAYKIYEVMPFNLKKLNEKLRMMDVGRAVVKRRGSPVEPREIENKLKLKGEREITVVLTRSGNHSIAIICQPITGV